MVDSMLSNSPRNNLEKLKKAYEERLDSEFQRLETLASRLCKVPSCEDALNELHAALHTMASTFGFHLLGQKARKLEQLVAKNLPEPTGETLIPVEWLMELKDAHSADNSEQSEETMEASQQTIVEGSPCIWLVERDDMLVRYAQSQLGSFGFQVFHLRHDSDLKNTDHPAPDLLLIGHRAVQCEETDMQSF